MKNVTDGETKNFNSKLWIRIICIVLSLATVAIACLGAAAFVSNGKVESLQADLNGTNDKLEALKDKHKAAKSEVEALQSGLTLTEEALAAVTDELVALKTALAQSKVKQESLENNLNILKNTHQSSQAEIDQLKGELENAKGEINSLKQQQNDSEEKIRIYIDQGHNPTQYHNSGASGNGLREEDVTFLIGCLLADLLRTDGRFEVQLSRPNKSVVLGTDNKSSLMARVDGAAAFEADYLISLHTNSFTQDSVTGIEVYVADKTGEAYTFGESLLDGLVESTNLRDRGMKLEPDFDVLEFSTMPAVLVEMGFISNATDAALFDEHPELFAQGMYNGILEYFGLILRVPSAT